MSVKLLKPILGVLITKAAILGGWYLWKKFLEEEAKNAADAKEKFRFEDESDDDRSDLKEENLSAQTTQLEKSLKNEPVKTILKASKKVVKTPETLTTQQAADLVGISRASMVKKIDNGEIPLHEMIGVNRKVLKSDVLKWKKAHK